VDPRQRFGFRVRQLRVRCGWTQTDLAERSGLHRTYIGAIERGERNVSLLNIHLLADALGVAPEALFTEVSSDPSSPESDGPPPGVGRRGLKP
jgi:transcriptional regulator with XRE-family HTH domain